MEQVTIVITESAYNDLEDIENYISQDSPLMARRFINKIFDRIDQLYNYPTSGKPVPEIKDKSIRELLLNKYVSSIKLSMSSISASFVLFMAPDCWILKFDRC